MAKSPVLDKKALSRKLESNHRSIHKMDPLNELEILMVKFVIDFKFSLSLRKLICIVILSQGTGNEIPTLCKGDSS